MKITLIGEFRLFPVGVVLGLFLAPLALAGFSVDEPPREVLLDPGDIFLPGLPPVCEVDDGDGSCPNPSLLVRDPENFDLDAFAVDERLQVCPPTPGWTPGILFSIDDGDPGPGSSATDNATEIFFYDHCRVLGAGGSYHTGYNEAFIGLGANPPPTDLDDDVDAYETRPVLDYWEIGVNLLFSPDFPSTGNMGVGSEGNIYAVNSASISPVVWATPADLGLPNIESCDIDGIAPVFDPDNQVLQLLFTTDHLAPCGLDPGDIYVSDLAGSYWLYADDVMDLMIALSEEQEVDIDALAINTDGEIEIIDPYDPPDPTVFKADWPNYAPSGMPDFSQDHSGWPGTWCGPAAMADSFWWFDSELECDRDRTRGDNAETEPNDTCDLADILGEVPALSADMTLASDTSDWYVFEVPYRQRAPYCRVTISTCALRQPGDLDTVLELYDDCSAAGVPGTLLATNDDACPPDSQSEIVEYLEGGRYWVRVSRGATSIGTNYTLSLGIDCYRLVKRYPDEHDDHSTDNPRPLIEDLSSCMNTDDVWGTGSGHLGTQIPDMDHCIDTWLTSRNLDAFFTKRLALSPTFDEVALEIERSEDVVLLLGFYWTDGSNWTRCGGHWVTSAGVDIVNRTITLSDPALNNAEPPPAGNNAPGRVRGTAHTDHAPAVSPPPDHDDTENISHDRYAEGPTMLGPPVANWAMTEYGTAGTPTTCADVQRWCMGHLVGQNPPEPPQFQDECPGFTFPISVEVEAMMDVSPVQTNLCIYLDTSGAWPENLHVDKGNCPGPVPMAVNYDVIRGKLCNLKFRMMVPQVDLGYVQCLYDDVDIDQWDELSPDHTDCFGGWFYLARESIDPDYGPAYPGGEGRVPDSGGCP